MTPSALPPSASVDVGHVGTQAEYKDVYPAMPDTRFMMDALSTTEAASIRARRPTIVVDVGCGAGPLAVVLSRVLASEHGGNAMPIVATDISVAAASATQLTARRNAVPLLISRMDLLTAMRPGVVDLVCFHTPYVPTSDEQLNGAYADTASRCDNIEAASWTWAGGPRGRVVLDRLLDELPRLLSPTGVCYILFFEVAELVPDLEARDLLVRVVAESHTKGEHFFLVRAERRPHPTVALVKDRSKPSAEEPVAIHATTPSVEASVLPVCGVSTASGDRLPSGTHNQRTYNRLGPHGKVSTSAQPTHSPQRTMRPSSRW